MPREIHYCSCGAEIFAEMKKCSFCQRANLDSFTNKQIQEIASYFSLLSIEMRKGLQINPLTASNFESILEARAMMLASYHLESILDERHQ
jgi:thioredoxin-related protein